MHVAIACIDSTSVGTEWVQERMPFFSALRFLRYRHFDLDIAEACHVYGVQLCPYGVLSGGFLSGKYLRGQNPQGCRLSDRNFQARYASPKGEQSLLKLEALAKRKGLTCTQLAVAWCVFPLKW
jgi:aryl-alcohol dehydrogenase-like predicted oxidoreductase